MQISKRVFQENNARQIFRKTNISYPLIRRRTCSFLGKFGVPFSWNTCFEICMCACQGVRNVRFSENFACFVIFFLKHALRDSPFCHFTDDLWSKEKGSFISVKFLSFLRKSIFDFSDIQMSWRHKCLTMKHETHFTE